MDAIIVDGGVSPWVATFLVGADVRERVRSTA
jgi:hypothetical protein